MQEKENVIDFNQLFIQMFQKFKKPIPNNKLGQLNTISQIADFLSVEKTIGIVSGNPLEELFDGIQLPPNVRTISCISGRQLIETGAFEDRQISSIRDKSLLYK